MTLLKKLLIVQILLLAGTLAMGAGLKFGLFEQARLVHRGFATAGGIAAIVSTIIVFTNAQPKSIKVMAVLTLILTFAAAIGGKMAASGVSYNASYGLMVAAGSLATLLSIVMFFKGR